MKLRDRTLPVQREEGKFEMILKLSSSFSRGFIFQSEITEQVFLSRCDSEAQAEESRLTVTREL